MSKKKSRRKVAAERETTARAMVSVSEVLKRQPATTPTATKTHEQIRRELGAYLKN